MPEKKINIAKATRTSFVLVQCCIHEIALCILLDTLTRKRKAFPRPISIEPWTYCHTVQKAGQEVKYSCLRFNFTLETEILAYRHTPPPRLSLFALLF